MNSTFTLMSSNVCCWGNGSNTIPNRMPRVLKLYKKYLPDLIGTQETTLTWKKFFEENLKEYGVVGEPRENIADPEHTAILYKKERFDLIETKTFALSESGEFGSLGWDEEYPRVATYAILLDKVTGKKLAFFDSHLALSDFARPKMLELIFAEIKRLNMPALFTGDFNTTEKSESYKLCIDKIFDDTKYLAKDSDEGYTFHGYEGEDEYEYYNNSPIDYCLVTKNDFEVDSYKILREHVDGKPISDHYPVLCTISQK